MKNNFYAKFLSLFTIILLIYGCSDDRNTFFMTPKDNQRTIKYDSLKFGSENIDLSNTSFVGHTVIKNDFIYFLDKYFSLLYVIDKDLNVVGRHVGQGRGRGEVPMKNVYGYAIDEEGNHILLGTTDEIYTISPSFDNVEVAFYHYQNTGNSIHPMYTEAENYCPVYEDLYINFYHGKLFIAIEGTSRDLTDFTQISEKWYKHSRMIMEIDKEKGAVDRVFGRVSPNVPVGSGIFGHFFQIDSEGNFYVGFQADSVMYKYDNDYNLLSAFGYDGIGITKDYGKIPTELDKIKPFLIKELDEKGYFTSMTMANGHIFRTYRTGGDNNQDRMQIYEGETLVGDVAIPEQFKVTGYIAPYYYSNIVCDEDEERLTIYKFKL